MTLGDSVLALRLRLMARAHELVNVSRACREFGVSRTRFCRWRARYLAYGPDGLRPSHQGPQRGRRPLLSAQDERAILALAWPTWGPQQLSDQLRRPEHGCLRAAPTTNYRLLRRRGLRTCWERLAVLEVHSAQAAGLLTQRTRRQWPPLSAVRRRTCRRRSPGSSSVWTPSTSAS